MIDYVLYNTGKKWIFTTSTNYRAKISDAHKNYDFTGFDGLHDILNYVLKYFKITRDQILIIN